MSARTNEVRKIALLARKLLSTQLLSDQEDEPSPCLGGAIDGLASAAEILANELDALEHRIMRLELFSRDGASTRPASARKPTKKKGGAEDESR